MKFLFFDMGSYTYKDFAEALIKKGHSVETMYYCCPDKYEDFFLTERLSLEITTSTYDAIISVNFYPIVAKVAHEYGIIYISWSYDSPLEEGFESYFAYDTNYIFLFDSCEVASYRKKGYSNVYHLPLAVNLARLNKLDYKKFEAKYASDVSFVGSLYNSDLKYILSLCDEYTRGYVESLVDVQLELYGTNLVDLAVDQKLIDRVNTSYISNGQKSVSITQKGLSYAISKHITNIERTILLNECSNRYRTNFYGYESGGLSDNVMINGPLKYYSEMNYVFRNSKVNLCPTLRSISAGIPLRALDIMAAGGLLISNYQPELSEWFVDGESVVMYESLDDAIEKIGFYIANDGVREKIIDNSREILSKAFTYESRIDEMVGTVWG